VYPFQKMVSAKMLTLNNNLSGLKRAVPRMNQFCEMEFLFHSNHSEQKCQTAQTAQRFMF